MIEAAQHKTISSTQTASMESDTGLSEMKQVKPLHGLQFKSTILVVFLMLSVATTSSVFVARAGSESLHGLQQEMLAKLVATLAHTVSQPLAEGDRSALQTIANEASNGSPLVFVRIEDAQSRLLATARHEITASIDLSSPAGDNQSNTLGRPTWRAANKITPAILEITYPITLSSTGPIVGSHSHLVNQRQALIGYVRAGVQANAWQGILAERLDTLSGAMFVAALLAVPLGFLVVRRVVAPLHSLSKAMNRFSQGDFSTRSQVNRTDEIGMIQTAFNRMADEHQSTHKSLLNLNTELEQRVSKKVLELRELVARDPLTGLFNRRYFNETLAQSFAEAQRYEQDLTCIMLDLDDFKTVNDTLGHQAGDRFLTIVANTIHAELRQADVPARFGGDEFVILLPQTAVDQAYSLTERIMEKSALACALQANQCSHTISAGIACLSALKSSNTEELIREADRAMYQAKTHGKNCIVIAGEDISRSNLQPLS